MSNWHREQIDREPDHGQYANDGPSTSPDYAEVLRLYRRYQARPKESLWEVFVRVGQRLEKLKPDRCPQCHYTDLGYNRLVDPHCPSPWHSRSRNR